MAIKIVFGVHFSDDFTRCGREQKNFYPKDLIWKALYLMKQTQISGTFNLCPFRDVVAATLSLDFFLLGVLSHIGSFFVFFHLPLICGWTKLSTVGSFRSVEGHESVLVISLLCWKLLLLWPSSFSTSTLSWFQIRTSAWQQEQQFTLQM